MPRPINVLFYVPQPVFNQFEVGNFEGFDKSSSSSLWKNLLINQIEVISLLKSDFTIFALFHQFDIGADGLDELQRFDNIEVLFFEEGNQGEILREIIEETRGNQKPLMVVNPLMMGLNIKIYENLIKLLESEEEISAVIRSVNGFISAIGFNYFEQRQTLVIANLHQHYNKLLPLIMELDSKPLLQSGGIVVKNAHDFKELYIFLSSKESVHACSYEMHDRFTELFVEYKEYL
jgi:hypothetical protein